MDQSFKELMIKDFMEELASNSPAPGGGSVAALAASLGSSLSSMVFNLTVGKKVYNEYQEGIKTEIKTQLQGAQEYKDLFLRLMDKDTEAFMTLMATFKLPKDTEEEKKIRSAKIQEGYIGALEVPLEMAMKAYEVYDFIDVACKYGNKNAISDAGVAALMTQAGIESAILNVRINLSSIKNQEYKEKIEKQCKEVVEKGTERREAILERVTAEIGC